MGAKGEVAAEAVPLVDTPATGAAWAEGAPGGGATTGAACVRARGERRKSAAGVTDECERAGAEEGARHPRRRTGAAQGPSARWEWGSRGGGGAR